MKINIEENLYSAIATEVPDCFDQIWEKAKNIQPGNTEKDSSKKKKIIDWRRIYTYSISAVAVCMLAFIGNLMYKNGKIDTIVGLDVNPSMEISVNQKNKVVKAVPLNEDAQEILEDMDLKGVDMKIAVNATIGAMVQKGYLSEEKNTVLFTVDNKDKEKEEEIREELNSDVKEALEQNNIDGTVLNASLKETEKLQQIADRYGISVSKAAYLTELVDEYPEFSMEELSKLTMDEIVEKIVAKELEEEQKEREEEEREREEERLEEEKERAEAEKERLEEEQKRKEEEAEERARKEAELKKEEEKQKFEAEKAAKEEEIRRQIEAEKQKALQPENQPGTGTVPDINSSKVWDDDDRDDDDDDRDDHDDDDDDRDDHDDDDDDRDDHDDDDDDRDDDDDDDDRDDDDDDRGDHDDDDDDHDDDDDDRDDHDDD